MFLAERVDFGELLFPLFEGKFDNLMILGLVGINGIEFVQVIKVHLDQVLKPVTIHLQIGVSGVDGLIQGGDNLLLPVIGHNDHLENVGLRLLHDLIV